VYQGVDIIVYEKSILVGGQSLFFDRTPHDGDIEVVKGIIDLGRRSLRKEIVAARQQVARILGEKV